MDTRTTKLSADDRQIAVALQELIIQNEATLDEDISSGDEAADEAYRHGVQTVLADIKQLLNDLGEGFGGYDSERPFIPVGFKLHSVVTH